MRRYTKIFALTLLLTVSLQSCYTMLNPPKTLPETVTTVISEPVIVSSLGGSGYYGWDPYWEPVLPYTNYHRSYGRSYYSPYNYYDYHHSYYRPIYVVEGESEVPVVGRDFSRDQKKSGRRDRTVRPGTTANTGTPSSMSTAAPVVAPPVTAPIIQPAKPVRKQTEVKSDPRPSKKSSATKQQRVRSSNNSSSKKKESSSSDSKNKRSRTKK